MMKLLCTDQLLAQLSCHKIVIYGSGTVGKRFLKGLERNSLKKNVVCFAVSSNAGDGCEGESCKYEIEGIPVTTVENLEVQDDFIFCIAVHEAVKDEIVQTLLKRRIENYIWIYPFLYDLNLGHPIERDVDIDVDQTIQCATDYRIAVRYMAIEQYFGQNTTGYDLYIRSHLVHCEKRTAEKRLQKFCNLIHNWAEHGVDQNSRILINTQYKIIDGHHRIAAAKYFGVKKLKGNVFSDDLSLEELHGREAVLTEEILRAGGFTDEEIRMIDEKNKYIRGE